MPRPRYLEITANCKHLFVAELLDEDHETIVEYEGYVPDNLGIGGNDDVELTIDLDTGMIVGWQRPSDEALMNMGEEDLGEDEEEGTIE